MNRCLRTTWLLLLLGWSANTPALTPLSDAGLSDVSGGGLAFALNNFDFMMRPTSYFEEVGTPPGAGAGFQRGDLRWYGLNITSATGTGNGSNWNDNPDVSFGTVCDALSIGCPRGGPISWFSPYDNPYMIRAYSPKGVGRDGTTINVTPGDKTVYEYLAPTAQPNYKFSFWGELEVGRDNNGGGDDVNLNVATGHILKSQTIIQGNASGSVFRMFNMTGDNDASAFGNSAGEYALFYHSYLNGDFRFSTAQAAGDTHDTSTVDSQIVGKPVVFDATGGMYFKNVHAFIPLGQLYYQAITLKSIDANGNFGIFMPAIPNVPTVYNDFYALRSDDATPGANGMGVGYETARLALLGNNAYVGFYHTTATAPNWVQNGDNSWKVTGYSNTTAYGYRTPSSTLVPYTANSTKAGHVNPNNCTFYEVGGATPAACPQTGNPYYPTYVDPNNTPVTSWNGNNAGLMDYTKTHGYSIWGDWYPSCYDSGKSGCYGNASGPSGTRNAYNASDDGIYYQSCSACSAMTAYAKQMTGFDLNSGASYSYYSGANTTGTGVNAVINSSTLNLGDARISGMIINKLTLTSCMQSAGGAC